MTVEERAFLADLEVVELLREEPALLAVADAVAATQVRPRRRRLLPRLLVAAAALAVALALVQLGPWEREGDGIGERALAAVGHAPVLHAVLRARDPHVTVIELASGREVPVSVRIEYWFDEGRGRLRTVVRRGDSVTDEILQTRGGAHSAAGAVRTLSGSRPALDPALAGFMTGYREELAGARPNVVGHGRVDGREVVWLDLRGERVAIDEESYRPLRIRPAGGAYEWTVTEIESVSRARADLRRPRPAAPAPFRGDVRESTRVSSARAAALSWPALWLGESFAGLRPVAIELQRLTRGYPPETRRAPTRGVGLRLAYRTQAGGRYVEIQQAPRAEPAYAFPGGRATFSGNPIPREGSLDLAELPRAAASGWVGQMRRGGVYVTLWASSRELCVDAARALRRLRGTARVGGRRG